MAGGKKHGRREVYSAKSSPAPPPVEPAILPSTLVDTEPPPPVPPPEPPKAEAVVVAAPELKSEIVAKPVVKTVPAAPPVAKVRRGHVLAKVLVHNLNATGYTESGEFRRVWQKGERGEFPKTSVDGVYLESL